MKRATAAAARAKKMKVKAKASIVCTLPEDMIVEIVAQLAAHSPEPIADLYNLRTTCKALYAASKERFVARRVAVEKEKSMSWWAKERYVAVVAHCAVAGNVEACFIFGLMLIFKDKNMALGMLYLDQAANAGHKAAAYVLGLLFYKDGDAREAGMRHFNRIEGEDEAGDARDIGKKIRRTNKQCEQCRRRAVDVVRDVTWPNPAPPGGTLVLPGEGRCASPGCSMSEGWGDCTRFCSDACRIGHEYLQFFTQIQKCLPG